MTNVKNEVDFLAKSNDLKIEAFSKMCNVITDNYNLLAKSNLKFKGVTYSSRVKEEPVLFRLFEKLNHMAFDLYSPQSLPDFLKRIVTKPVKVISKPEYKEQPEIYGKGHFRWDYRAYTLNENELQAIRIYLGLHVKSQKQTSKVESVKPLGRKAFDELGYEEKAEYFLNYTSTSFSSSFKEHSTYFDDDKTTRDIYTIVLKNKSHRYRFLFGQSISNTGKHPTAYDVLACLQKNDIGNFDDFCDEFGYEKDSRKAYKTYKAVLKEWKNVELLFTEKEIELLQEIN